MQEGDNFYEGEPEPQSSGGSGGRKRNDMIHMKILVPSGVVGAIIGKGGRSIAQVQSETGARIKLSKPNDFYPGTTERVCLIQGTLDGVTRMHDYIMDRMLEKPECAVPLSGSNPSRLGVESEGAGSSDSSGLLCSSTDASISPSWNVQHGSRLLWGRHQQVKILVPNCTAGLVIGKLGSYVKEIKDRTKAFIQISQKSKEINLLERCITIAGEPDQCRAAVALVLAKIAEDPQSTNCPTISYSGVQGPVASAYPTGSPFAFATTCAQANFPTQTMPSDEQPQPGFMPLANPYTSPMLQAAFLQAAAAATALSLNPRAYYSPQASPGTTFFGQPASPTVHQPQQPQLSSPFGASFVASGDGDIQTTVESNAASPGHLVSTNVWPGCDLAWASAVADPSTSSANITCGQTSYEAAYQAPFNFAYYPTNHPVLTPVLTQSPTEAYTLNPELYSSPSYATPMTGQSTFRVTSPNPYGQTTAEVIQTPSNLMNLPQSTIPLSDLFSSLRLSHPAYVDYSGPRELNPFFAPSTPGLVNAPGLSTQTGMISSPQNVVNPGRSATEHVSVESIHVVSTRIAAHESPLQGTDLAPSIEQPSPTPPLCASANQMSASAFTESDGRRCNPAGCVSQNGKPTNNGAKPLVKSNCHSKQQQCVNGQATATVTKQLV